MAIYTALSQFTPELINKIDKIILFDDCSLNSGWCFYHADVPINIEIIDCPRIHSNKSTLDVKMSSYITAAHYKDEVDGFILASSDSDYWGLIDTIGVTANFFVIGEKAKMSPKTKTVLSSKRISYCLLDDFYDANIKERIRKQTYKEEIKTILEKSNINLDFFLNLLNNQTAYLSNQDKETFRRIACGLKISFDESGKIIIEL